MIVTLPADRLDEVREIRVELHRHHSAIPVPAGWVSRDEDEAWADWRRRAGDVLADDGVLFVHCVAEGERYDGLALVAMLAPEELVRPVLAADGPQAELLTLAVLPDTRGAGVGAQLYAAATEWSRERGAVAMQVDTRAANVAGLRFYERQGARPAFVQLMHRL